MNFILATVVVLFSCQAILLFSTALARINLLIRFENRDGIDHSQSRISALAKIVRRFSVIPLQMANLGSAILLIKYFRPHFIEIVIGSAILVFNSAFLFLLSNMLLGKRFLTNTVIRLNTSKSDGTSYTTNNKRYLLVLFMLIILFLGTLLITVISGNYIILIATLSSIFAMLSLISIRDRIKTLKRAPQLNNK